MMKAVLISASNIVHSGKGSTSYKLCSLIEHALLSQSISCEVIDLRDYHLTPCIGCGQCFEKKRCCTDAAFNQIYDKVAASDCSFIVSPHYAPVPAKLCMLLEKMEEITFLHWWKNEAYRSEVYQLPVGIISHGGGSDWALSSYRKMVNDTIANALDTIQCKVIPYDDEWDTGISIPVSAVEESDRVFPIQNYDWKSVEALVLKYAECVLRAVS